MSAEQEALPILRPFHELPFREINARLDKLPDNIHLRSPEPSASFVTDIKLRGVITPIVITQDDNDEYVVKAGKRRIKAARKAGLKTIKARVYDPGVELDLAEGAENAQRDSNPLSDLALITSLSNEGYTEKQISKLTGIKVGTIRKRLKLRGLGDELMGAALLGKMNMRAAEVALSLGSERRKELHGLLKANGKITTEDVYRAKAATREAAAVEIELPNMDLPDPDPNNLLFAAVFGESVKWFSERADLQKFVLSNQNYIGYRLIKEM
jgi:ParB/RepB/Spo0J family partition protein